MKKAVELLLEAGSLPDNLEAYLRRVLEALLAADAGGKSGAAAALLAPGTLTPRLFAAAGFSRAEVNAFRKTGIDGLAGSGLLSAAVRGGDADGLLTLRPGPGVSRAAAGRALAAAARAVSARLTRENRELLLTKERDTADAAAHLEEVLLSMPELSLAEISRAVLDEARRLTGSPAGFAGYFDPASGELRVPACEGAWKRGREQGELSFKEFHGPWGWMLKHRSPLLKNALLPGEKPPRMPRGHLPTERFVGAPAMAGPEPVGVLALLNSPREYTPADLEAVKKLARVYALAIRNKLSEARKRADDEKHGRLLDSASDLIFSMRPDGRLLYINKACERYGYSREEVTGRHFRDFIHPADRASVMKAFRAAMRTGRTAPSLHYRLRRKNGGAALVEQLSTVTRLPGGELLVAGSLRDLSEVQRAESLVNETREKYRALFETSSTAIMLADAATGMILDANHNAELLTGRSLAELKAIHHADLLPPDFREKARKSFRSLSRREHSLLAERELLRPDGSLVPVLLTSSRVKIDGREAMQATFTDISALKASENKYRALVDSTDTGYLILDDRGRVIDANAEYLRLTGRAKLADILGRQVTEWTAWYDRDRNAEEVRKCLKRGIVRNLAIDYEKPDGEITPVEINATVIRTGSTFQIVSLCRDITQRRTAEALLKESEERYRLLFENSADPVLIAGEDGAVLAVNSAATRTYGYSREQLLRMKISDIEAAGGPAALGRRVAGLLVSSHIRLEARHRLKSGAEITVEGVSQAMTWGGRPATLNTYRDITARKKVEAALRESEGRYRALFSTSRDALMLIGGPDWRFLQANAATLEMFGVESEQVFMKLSPWDLSPERQPDGEPSSEKATALLRRAEKDGSAFFEWTHTRTGGAEFTAEVLLTRIALGGRNIIQATVRDISARKQMERQVLDSEHFLNKVLNNIPDMVFVKDARDLKLVRVNAAGERIFGAKTEQLAGRTDYDFFPKEEADFFTAKDREVLESGRLMDIPEEKIHSAGGEILLHTKKLPILGQDGRPLYLLGLSEDITERRKMEEQLRQNEATLQQIFDSAEDAIFLKGLDGRYIKVNKACGRLFQIDPAKMPGRTAHELFPAGYADNIEIDDREAVKAGRTIFTNRDKPAPGGRLYLSVARTPIRGLDGAITGILGVARDVTALKKMEAELAIARASDALSTVARPMVHDFNNALTAISGYATLINDDMPDSNPIKKELAQIIKAVTRAAEISSKLQDFARNPRLEEHGPQAGRAPEPPQKPKKKKKKPDQ